MSINSNMFVLSLSSVWASQVAQCRLPMQERQETWFRSLGQEDPLQEEVATHSSILAWEVPWTEEPGGLPSLQS